MQAFRLSWLPRTSAARWSRPARRWRPRWDSTSSWPAWASRCRRSCCSPSSSGCGGRIETALLLARRWSQAMGVLVAVGAVTGTVLSFEMGLLWPGLMRQYGSVLGFPFGVEGSSSSWRRSSPGSTCGAGGGCRGGRTGGRGVPIAVSGHLRRDVGDRGELVDEPAGRVHRKRRPDHLGQPVAGVLQPRRHLRDAAHDPGRVHGRRVHRRRHLRGRHPARPPGPLPLRRLRHRVRAGRDR